jgi:hypothetical protein
MADVQRWLQQCGQDSNLALDDSAFVAADRLRSLCSTASVSLPTLSLFIFTRHLSAKGAVIASTEMGSADTTFVFSARGTGVAGTTPDVTFPTKGAIVDWKRIPVPSFSRVLLVPVAIKRDRLAWIPRLCKCSLIATA